MPAGRFRQDQVRSPCSSRGLLDAPLDLAHVIQIVAERDAVLRAQRALQIRPPLA